MLKIIINIGDVATELMTDQALSFDAIESLLNRAVQSTVSSYLSLPTEDRLAALGLDTSEDDDDEEDDALLKAQNNSCAICGIHTSEIERGLVVDHNHETHKIRGLLCTRCNVGLGYYGDDTTKLSMAIEYLIKTDGIA